MTLLIHGGADTYNPTAMAHELHAAQPHADLWIVPGADHVMSYFTDPGAYRKRVEQFLRRLPQALFLITAPRAYRSVMADLAFAERAGCLWGWR